jgi:trimeric autotransporter adhesin
MKGKPPFVCRVSVERFANRDNGPAVNAQLVLPNAIALDNLGNLYVTDNNDYVIRKIDVTGKITTVVPPGQLYNTYGLTADSAGNLYIADTEHCRVMKLAGSTLTQFAGIGTPGNSNCGDNGDGGTATAAQLDHPYGLIFDKAGNLYIAESGGNIIRKIDTSGNISTLVGTGGAGSGGDGGPLLAAQLNGPQGVALDAAGNLYIAEAGSNYVRKVGTTAAVSFPAVRVSPIAGRTQQVLLQINRTLTISSVAVQPAIGGVAEYTIGTLQGCTADGTTQQSAGTTCTIPITFSPKYPGFRSVPLQITTSAGNLSFPLTGTGLASQVAITPGTITTFAGNGTAGDTGDSGPATAAELSGPGATAVDAAGNLYIADSAFPSIRKVDAITGTITTVAGNGVAGYAADGGVATAVSIRGPRDVAIDAAGSLYFAELDTSSIRKVDAATGILTTYAGINQSPGYTGDGGPVTSAKITSPTSIALDRAGNLYIPDSTNNVVRKVNAATGIITTVAGNGTRGYFGDNGPATSANLAGPLDVAVDASGNLYIADTYNFAIRNLHRQSDQRRKRNTHRHCHLHG